MVVTKINKNKAVSPNFFDYKKGISEKSAKTFLI